MDNFDSRLSLKMKEILVKEKYKFDISQLLNQVNISKGDGNMFFHVF